MLKTIFNGTTYYVHPHGGHADHDEGLLVLHRDGPENRLKMCFDGSLLKSMDTGKYVHPLGGTAHGETKLCFHGDRDNSGRISLEAVYE